MPQTTLPYKKFLANMVARITEMKKPSADDIRPLLDEVFLQGGHEAIYRADERRMREFYAAAVENVEGSVKSIAERAGVSAETIERWLADPMGMRLSEERRLDLALGVSRTYSVESVKEQS
jgi:hypothetical protein